MDEEGLKSMREMTHSLKQKLKKYGLALEKRGVGVDPDPDPSQSNRERSVDLGKDSDTLVLSVDVVCDFESECGESVSNECDLSAEKMEVTEPIAVDVDVEETEVVDKMMVEENCKWVRLSGNSNKVDSPEANPNPNPSPGNTNLMEIAKDRGLTFDRPRWWPSDEVIAREW